MVNRNVDVDSDLEDLLGDKKSDISGAVSDSPKKKLSNYYDDPQYYQRPTSKYSTIYRIPELLCYYFTQFLIFTPSCGKLLIFSALGLVIYSLLNLTAPRTSIGRIKYDFSSVTSQYDFDIGKVDHWCITGGDDCACPDPLHPQPRLHKAWHTSIHRHMDTIYNNMDADVVFVGQSVVEVMNGFIGGSDMRNDGAEYFGRVNHIFEKRFGRENKMGARNEADYVTGVALGATGDTFSNVLWRLMNGEMPPDFKPPIWWLVLGMEDIGRYGCSEEITVMGVLRIVEEIQKHDPNARIVINSLLPMMTMRQEVEDEQVQNIEMEYKDVEERPHESKKSKRKHDNEKGHDRVRRLEHFNGQERWKEKKAKKEKREQAKIEAKEAKRDEKRERKYVKELHQEKFNPTMTLKEKFRKERGEKGRLHIPVWTAIHEINRELHAFSKRTTGVNYFDATELFSAKTDNGHQILLTDYITVRGHPTPEGFKVWLNAVQEQARNWKIEAGRNHDIYYDREERDEEDDYYLDEDKEGVEEEESEEGDDEDEDSEEGDDEEEEDSEEDDAEEATEEGDDVEGDDEEATEEGDDDEGDDEEATEEGDDDEGDDEEATEEGDDDEGDDEEATEEGDDDEGDDDEATEEGDDDEESDDSE